MRRLSRVWWLLPMLSLVACASPDTDDALQSATPMTSPVVATVPDRSVPVSPSTIRSDVAAPTAVNRTTTFGFSVKGRPLTVTEIGNPASHHRVLIVGCIHGSECSGIAITSALRAAVPSTDVDFWLVPDLNPDGYSLGTRQNANGVDLNRNFPFKWMRLGSPGSSDYSGRASLSQPESAAAAALIVRIHPTLAIWFHQHEGVVDDSQGPLAIERRLSTLIGLPLSRLTDYPGSVVGWEDATFGPTAFVVELGAGPMAPATVQRYTAAIEDVASMGS
jgi:murein peptide amidase A